jgi:HTH-type transcriptional regulator / antitoxin HipB
MYTSHYADTAELGEAVSTRRKTLGLNQSEVSLRSGIARESLVRFERGRVSEFGSRKLLAVLAVLGLEMSFTEVESQVPSTNCGANGVALEAECPRPRSPRWHS